MPPDQLPWDRREFRKHERSGSDPRFGGGGFGSGPHRWREQHHNPHAPPPMSQHPQTYHHHHNPQPPQRWYSDFRSSPSRPIPPGHGKQGGWHMYPDESGHGFPPFGSRHSDRNLADASFRPLGFRGDGRYLRNSRESKGSFSQKDWRSPSWESNASPSGPGKPTAEVNNQKSVEHMQACQNNSIKKSDSNLISESPSDQSQSQSISNEKYENVGPAGGLAKSGQRFEKVNSLGSLGWEPVKWSRSSSLSLRCSGFSNSTSSRGMGVDSMETVADGQPKNVIPVESSAAASVASCVLSPSDETSSRKKPRLGWGEGLAKYEKKKVEGPDDVAEKVVDVSFNTAEAMQSPTVNLLDKSPRVACLSACDSPATPSSVACTSPGTEENESIKAGSIDHCTDNLRSSPCTMSQAHYEGPTFNLENLELSSITKLSSLTDELIQPDGPGSVETNYGRNTSMNKLLVWKVDVLKALEVTESEIDSLETKYKSLIAEPGSYCPHPAILKVPTGESHLRPCLDVANVPNFTVEPDTLREVSSEDAIIVKRLTELENKLVSEDKEIDGPCSAPRKLIDAPPCRVGWLRAEVSECAECSLSASPKSSCSLDKTSSWDYIINEDHTYDSIVSSNKDFADRAAEVLNKFLPSQQYLFNSLTSSSLASVQRNLSVVKEKFLMRRRALQFNEKILILKYKVFQHFWKEGRVVSLKKLRGKSHKFDLTRTGYKKNRSSGRFRLPYSVSQMKHPSLTAATGPLSVPAEEVVEFVNWLLSNSPFRPCRSNLKMPALILDKQAMLSRFISNNCLVDDPCVAEEERSMINPWTTEEREIFIDKLAICGKNFRRIALFLDHKTVADCVEFYYKNHKSECFSRARKKTDSAKQRKSQSTTYLVATGKRWNREVNAVSLDILGEASVIAANANNIVENQPECRSRMCFGSSCSQKSPRDDEGPLHAQNSLDMYSNETAAADVLAGICVSLSSEAMSSCITSSVDPTDGNQDWKLQRLNSCKKRPLTPEVTQAIEDDDCSEESCGEMDSTDWTDEEKSFFIQAVSSYGKDFLMISNFVRTRSRDQCKVFFSKARKCLGLDLIGPSSANVDPYDINGGCSDTEGACAMGNAPLTRNISSGSKKEEDLSPTGTDLNLESDAAGIHIRDPEFKICGENRGPCPLDSMAAQPNSVSLSVTDEPFDSKAVKENNVLNLIGSEVALRSMLVSSEIKSVQVEERTDCGFSGSVDGHEHKRLVCNSTKEDLEYQPTGNKGTVSCEVSDTSCAGGGIIPEDHLLGKESHPLTVGQSSVPTGSDEKKENGIEKFNGITSCVISMQQRDQQASVLPSRLFPVPIKYQRNSSTDGPHDIGTTEVADMNSQKMFQTGNNHSHRSYHVESSQILRGYPVSVRTLKEINGDANCKTHVPLESNPKHDKKLQSGQLKGFFLQKCSNLRHQHETLTELFQSQEQNGDHTGHQSGCTLEVDKPYRNGDLKLFGKILVPSEYKPSCERKVGDGQDQHDIAGCHSVNLKPVGDQKVHFDSSMLKFDSNEHLGSGSNLDQISGIRDDPGGAIYSAAFTNGSSAKLKLDQLPVHKMARGSDHILNGVSVFPGKDLGSSNGVVDYHLLRNQELQPFTMDMKHHDVLFNEMQRRNGFEVVSGIQHQPRGMIGISVGARGGVLVGGQCSNVSDPVAAIKMHYSKAQSLSPQGANMARETDAWRINGDVGR